jgi:sec-independent protein translocase protein TatA
MDMPQGREWIWIFLAIVVLFGASRIPALARSFGQGIREFKTGLKEPSKDDDGKTPPPKS